MKFFLPFFLFLISLTLPAQDVFQRELFSTDLILKYRTEINLEEGQATRIQEMYSANLEQFNRLKWDLDQAMSNLAKQITPARMSEPEVLAMMDHVSELEAKLKRIRLAVLVRNKNILTPEQQEKLKGLRTDQDLEGEWIAINEHPRVVLKVNKDEKENLKPLYVLIDRKGKKTITQKTDDLNPGNIESITVYKNEKAIAKYGEQGKHGVIEIQLKK